METEFILELNNATEYEKSAYDRTRYTNVRGLSLEDAKKTGFFERIGKLLALLTVANGAAYRIFGQLDYMLSEYGVQKHEIKKNCRDFDSAFNRFLSSWKSEDYFLKESNRDLNEDIDSLYNIIMHFGRIPKVWHLGDSQMTEEEEDYVIRVDNGDKWLDIKRSLCSSTVIGEPVEEWCVTKYDMKSKKQETVYTNMKKADAQMVAKRLSAEDGDSIYTASVLTTSTEKRVVATPMKVYRDNNVVGDVKKVFKK